MLREEKCLEKKTKKAACLSKRESKTQVLVIDKAPSSADLHPGTPLFSVSTMLALPSEAKCTVYGEITRALFDNKYGVKFIK